MTKIQGIYQIKNILNEHVYIGSSNNIRVRWNEHRNLLRKNCHTNIHLQRAWNKYGEKNFVFGKLEDVLREEDLIPREQWFLNRLTRSDYNINMIAHKPPSFEGNIHSEKTKKMMREKMSGKNNGFYGKKHTLESLKKISEASKGKNNANWGKPMSEETKRKMIASRKGKYIGEDNKKSKLTPKNVIEIRELYATGEYTQTKLGEMFGVSQEQVSNIVRLKVWTHI